MTAPDTASERSDQAPADWYPDPEVPGGRRYWDGNAWTEHRQSESNGARSATLGRVALAALGCVFASAAVYFLRDLHSFGGFEASELAVIFGVAIPAALLLMAAWRGPADPRWDLLIAGGVVLGGLSAFVVLMLLIAGP